MIYIDSNENAQTELKTQIEKLTDFGIEVKNFNHGEDFLVSVDRIEIPVQRKSGSDFIASVQDDRLNNELYQLSTHYHFAYLLVEGGISYPLSQRGFKRQPFLGALLNSSLKRSPEGKRGQICIINVETDYDSAFVIYSLHKKLEEGMLERVPHVSGRKSDPERATLAILRQIPGIGKKRSQKLYECEEINSFTDLFEVDVRILQDTVGKKTGEKVHNFIHRKWT